MFVLSCITEHDKSNLEFFALGPAGTFTPLEVLPGPDWPWQNPYEDRGPRMYATPDGSLWLMMAPQQGRPGIYASRSEDLRTWTPPEKLDISLPGPLHRPLRPDAYWDWEKQLHRLIWTLASGSDELEGVWTASSKDFIHWTQPVLLLDPGYPVCEATVLGHPGSYAMAFTDARGALRPDTYFRAIRTAWSPMGTGPFMGISALLTPKLTQSPVLIREATRRLLIYEKTGCNELGALCWTPGEEARRAEAQVNLPAARSPAGAHLEVDPAGLAD